MDIFNVDNNYYFWPPTPIFLSTESLNVPSRLLFAFTTAGFKEYRPKTKNNFLQHKNF